VALRFDDIDLDRDRLLVEAWQAGEATAFDELYRRYFDRLRAFCQRRVGDRADAEELAQEAFVRALQALPRLEGERRFYPWLTVIAGRLCIDHHRRHHRVETTDEVDLGAVDDGHDARLQCQSELQHLDQALLRLTSRHAEVLDLRERHGLTYDEIAGTLGVPHSTVEALLFRARKALRREFRLVSAERLGVLPVLGWLRQRMAGVRPEVAALAAPLAAGAFAVVLVGLPPAPPTVVHTVDAHRPATYAAPAALTTTTTGIAAATPSDSVPTERGPAVRHLDATQAAARASSMPLHLDLGQFGVGVDPTPLITGVLP
jgi:RNA polymerase sigma-70 factor (ECF subfamily)